MLRESFNVNYLAEGGSLFYPNNTKEIPNECLTIYAALAAHKKFRFTGELPSGVVIHPVGYPRPVAQASGWGSRSPSHSPRTPIFSIAYEEFIR